MKTRCIPKTFDTIEYLGYQNLLVGGCSFTYNINDHHCSHWPYYVRDLGGFAEVYDCSMPGAGNQQISTSIEWALETNNFDPTDTMIIVMWSGHTRSGYLTSAMSKEEFQYSYAPNIWYQLLSTNTQTSMRSVQAMENYLYVLNLKTYLTQQKYPHVFLDFLDYSLPNRGASFDIVKHLPSKLSKKYQSWFAPIDSIYRYCVRNSMLSNDDFHPSTDGNLAWTREVLMPWLAANFDPV